MRNPEKYGWFTRLTAQRTARASTASNMEEKERSGWVKTKLQRIMISGLYLLVR